jgi:hypothetical protein
MPMDLSSVKVALETQDFAALIGEFENEWLECKGQPYDLSRDDQKLELAKDVSGLANAAGGLLILGYSTIRSDKHGEDQINELRAFPEERFLQAQYESVLASWIYPPLDGLKFERIAVPSKPDCIVVCINIPKAMGSNSPALVLKTIFESSRKVETLVGYFVRKQSHVAHYDAKRIQALFRDGLRYDADIRENFIALHNAIDTLRTSPKSLVATISPEEIDQSLTNALLAVQLQGKPTIALSAVPGRTLDLTKLFESNTSELVRLVESPPQLRSSGFNLGTGERSKIINGKLRRAVDAGYKVIEVHRSGLVVFVNDGGHNGLCWGRASRQQQARLINQIALIEMVYLFCVFYRAVYLLQLNEGEEICIGLELQNLSIGDNVPRLEPGHPDTFSGFTSPKPAPSGSGKFDCQVTSSTTPERAAFLLLAEVYVWFGIETDKIPLTKLAPNQERIVDPDALSQM